jgi:hypothetical protein
MFSQEQDQAKITMEALSLFPIFVPVIFSPQLKFHSQITLL